MEVKGVMSVGENIERRESKNLLTLSFQFEIVRPHTEQNQSHMRTKTLLLTAALSAAGVIASMAAGVTSVNVVGYINVTVPPGFSFIANQLVASNDKISSLISAPPTGTVVYTWDGGFVANAFNQFGDNHWDNDDLPLGPGTGALIYNPDSKDFKVTFVGEVKQGTLTTAINNGFQFVSSQVPQEGTLSALGYTPSTGDVFYKWDGGFSADTYNSFGDNSWDSGTEPSLKVGQSALYFSTSGNDWVRTFNVP